MTLGGMSDEELDLLLNEGDDDAEGNAENQKKNNKFFPLAIIIILVAVVVGAVTLTNGGDSGENAGEETSTTEAPKDMSLQLVNLQQVAWADNMCKNISTWDKEISKLDKPDDEVFVGKARRMIVKNLKRNSDNISDIANGLGDVPKKSLADATKKASEATIVDNYLKVDDTVDEKTDSATRSLQSSLNGYASALKDLAGSMDSVASYNFDGMRDSIKESQNTLESMNKRLSKDVSNAFGEDFFDNTMTMKAVAELESCNGSVINSEELKKDKGQEISDQETLSDYLVMKRCKQFMENTEGFDSSDSATGRNRSACEEFLSSVTVDENDPVVSGKIEANDDLRVQPEKESQDDEKSKDDKSETSTEKKDSDSKTSEEKKSDK